MKKLTGILEGTDKDIKDLQKKVKDLDRVQWIIVITMFLSALPDVITHVSKHLVH